MVLYTIAIVLGTLLVSGVIHSLRKDSRISKQLQILIHNTHKIMNSLDALTTEVAGIDEVVPSVIALLEGLSAQVAELKPNQAAIDALAADLKARKEALSAAIIANTPSEETPPA